jgi:hypothetical protein
VARSARTAAAVRRGALAVLGALALAGCTTTQHEAQRERLDSARQRAALESTRVTVANTVVKPTAVAQVTAGGRTAFVVTVHNGEHRAVTDLPISVGYTTASGTSVYLNSAATLNYFEAHLPVIRAGHDLTWVYTVARTLPQGAKVFARVGLKRSVPALLTEMNVSIGLRYHYSASTDSLTVHLDNATSVPQYQLQLYAYAKRGSQYVGAANRTVMTLGAGTERSIRVGLLGVSGTKLHVQAIPTILQ